MKIILISKKYLICYFVILCLSIFSSCSSTSDMGNENDQTNIALLSPGELKAKINEKSSHLTSVDCEGDIYIDSPEINSSGSITLSILKPDSIYSKLEGPFGISLARFLITRNNFIYHNIKDNYVIKGPSTMLNLGSVLRLRVSYDDLLNGYTSSFHFDDTSSANSVVEKEKSNYILKIKQDEQTKVYLVNASDYYVERYEIFDKSGKTILQIQYSDFEKKLNIFTPKNIYITNPGEKQNLWISFGNKSFNNNRLKFKMSIPKSAKIIEWQ